MPQFKLPNGESIEVPDDISPELGQRLRAYHDSLLDKEEPIQGLVQPSDEGGIDFESMLNKTKALGNKAKSILPEVARVADTTIRGGILGIPNLALRGGVALENYVTGNAPRNSLLNKAVDKAIEYTTPMEPQTGIGKQAGNIGSSIVGAVTGTTPKNIMAELAKNYAIGASSGVGAEAAASIAGDNPVSRIIGGLVGGGLAGIGTSTKGNTGDLSRQALEGLDNNDLSRATKTMRQAVEEGVPINLAQALGKESNVDPFIDVLAKNPNGVQTAKLLREQPIRIVEETNKRISNLPGTVKSMHSVADDIQEGLTQGIKLEGKQAGEIWKQTRDKFLLNSPKEIPLESLNTTIKSLNDTIKRHAKGTADYKVIDDLRHLLYNEGKGISNPEIAYNALKDYKSGLGKQHLGNKNITSDAAKYGKSLAQDVMDSLGDAMRPYREADLAYSKYQQAVINPLKKSVVGRIVGRQGAIADREAAINPVESVFKSGTLQGADSEILKLQSELSKAGRGDAYIDGVKTYLSKKADEAFKTDSARVNNNVASGLTKTFGTKANPDSTFRGTRDMLIGVARAKGIKDDEALADGFSRFMKIVSNASFRPTPIAGTNYENIMKAAEKHIGSRVGGFTIISPIRQPMLMISEKLRNDSLSTMDKLLNTPEGISMLVQLGKSPAMNHKTQTALATSLATLNNLSTSSNQTGE